MLRPPFLLFLLAGAVWSIEFKSSTNELGLIFYEIADIKLTYSSYVLAYRFDMLEIYELPNKVENVLGKMSEICKKKNELKSCHSNLNVLKNKAKFAQKTVNVLKAMQVDSARMKRGVNKNSLRIQKDIETNLITIKLIRKKRWDALGRGLKWMTGVMDADDARDINKEFKKQKVTNEANRKNLKENRMVIEGTIALQNKSTETLLNIMAEQPKENIQMFQANEYEKTFENEILSLEMAMTDFDSMTQILLNILNGKTDEKMAHLIDESELKNDLSQIKNNLTHDRALPISLGKNHPYKLFKYTKVRSALIGNKLIMELKIPVVEENKFILHKVVPIPIKMKNHTLLLREINEYVLIDTMNSEFMPIKNDELKDCMTIETKNLVCKVASPTYLKDHLCEENIYFGNDAKILAEKCKYVQIMNENYITALDDINVYYVYAYSPFNLRENCINKIAKKYTISQNGMLTLRDNCEVVTDQIKIKAHTDIVINATTNNKILIPTISEGFEINELNLTKVMDSSNSTILIKNLKSDYENLYGQAAKAIDDGEDNEIISKHENFFYIIAYMLSGISAIILVMVTMVIYKHFSNKKSRAQATYRSSKY